MRSGGSGGKPDRSNQSIDVRPHGEGRVVALLSSYFIWALNPKPGLQHSESLLELANVKPFSPKMSMTLQQEGNLLLLGKKILPDFPAAANWNRISLRARFRVQSLEGLDFQNPCSKLGMLGFLECMFRAWNAFGFPEWTFQDWNAWIIRMYIFKLECLDFQNIYFDLRMLGIPEGIFWVGMLWFCQNVYSELGNSWILRKYKFQAWNAWIFQHANVTLWIAWIFQHANVMLWNAWIFQHVNVMLWNVRIVQNV